MAQVLNSSLKLLVVMYSCSIISWLSGVSLNKFNGNDVIGIADTGLVKNVFVSMCDVLIRQVLVDGIFYVSEVNSSVL